ncbi:TonB-dependent receptor [Neisseria sp. Dent CA1/247]|uniref:TonB-dependent receptor n=1 Tax=Neisseria sp. Dent CA1/247 TaxID=2912675 RepID=UPI001FD4CE18|nr:TonB-dependent receptor [Neisseria sp. Dent CA1/247]UOO76815.1 TonB-dependent receptor [Neisseria sp. Dent CA1/247]
MRHFKFSVSPLLLILSTQVWADVGAEHQQTLEEVTVVGKRQLRPQSFISGSRKASDVVIDGEKFKSRSATLGNALSGELGVHSNPFGGGASAPVIRGQEGVRIKILQNGSDVVDMSSLSPDHAVAADTLLAQQVELVRGTPTLLYSTASPAGVVNVVDKRIPDHMPKKGMEGEAALRFDTAAREKALNAGVTFGLGSNVAVRAEGLARKSENYRVPGINLGERLKYLPDSHNRSKVGTAGISWVGEQGYLGASYSVRRDKYGLPGHNHMLDSLSMHIFNIAADGSRTERRYLNAYPHLMDESDLGYAHSHGGLGHEHNPEHSHENPYGHDHDHSSDGPMVDMTSKRWDVRGEWRQPFAGVEKLKLALSHARYHHDELHDGKFYAEKGENRHIQERRKQAAEALKGKPESVFDTTGFNSRLEVYHRPVAGLQGMVGVQFSKLRGSAEIAPLPRPGFPSGADAAYRRRLLPDHTDRRLSLFGLEQYRYKDFTFEAAARWEKQRIPVHYDHAVLAAPPFAGPGKAVPDLSPRKEKAFSYSGTALWNFSLSDRLAFTASHNERLPSPMELYYHGRHLATNSFEFGNKELKKENSNNVELSWRHASDKWDVKLSTYRNRFRNFIHSETIRRDGNIHTRRYIQSQARFHGIEGEVGYSFAPGNKLTFFGDYVRGKLFNLPKVRGKEMFRNPNPRHDDEDDDYDWTVDPNWPCKDEEGLNQECEPESLGVQTIARPNRNAPRVSPARIGFRWEKGWGPNWSTSLEYTHVFTQNKTSDSQFVREKTRDEKEIDQAEGIEGRDLTTEPISEDKTKGYHLLNAGIAYDKRTKWGSYKLSLNGNNLLNQKIYIHNSFLPYVPQPGRNFVFGVNVKF